MNGIIRGEEASASRSFIQRRGCPAQATCSNSALSRKSGVGAVVVGGDFNGLGIVRSLGRNNYPVCIIDDEFSISRFSRYATYAVRVPELRDERCIVETVLRVGRERGLEGWVLYPTREEIVAAFSRYRKRLEEWFQVPTPDWNTIRWAWDKRNTYRKAQELSIPTPRTWYPSSLEELDQIDATPPLVLKPAIKEHFIYATRAKAWRAESRDQLRELFTRATKIAGAREIMVQELIPGDGHYQFADCALFKNGSALGSMVVRRRRQHPPEFGRASTFVETVDVPELEVYSKRFLRNIDYYGLVELEYKLDPRDSQYKLLDFNARTWGYHALGSRAGVDFPYMLFADQIGKRVQKCRASAGIKWIRIVTDFPTAALEILNGNLSVKEYLRSCFGFHVESVFCSEDPLPGLVELALVPYLYVKRGY